MSDDGAPTDPRAEAFPLIMRLFEDGLGEEDARRLEALVRGHKSVRRLYVRCAHQRCAIMPLTLDVGEMSDGPGAAPGATGRESLHDAVVMPAIHEADVPPDASEATGPAPAFWHTGRREAAARRWFGRRSRLAAVAAAALVLLAVGLVWLLRPARTGATLAGELNAQWDAPGGALRPGEPVPTGPVVLKAGLAQLTFENGVSMVVEGPARFEVHPADKGAALDLAVGKLAAIVPASGKGFAVRTASARVVDLGTEFGVEAGEDRSTHVEVFRGTVQAHALRAADPARAAQTLTREQAADVPADAAVVRPAAPRPETFVRAEEMDARVKAAHGSSFDRWRAYAFELRRDPDLVAYYTFDAVDDPLKLANRSSAGPALDGTLEAGGPGSRPGAPPPAWVAGRWGGKRAVSFVRGSRQRVAVTGGSGAGMREPLTFSHGGDVADAFTIAVWLKAAPDQPDGAGLVGKGAGQREQFALDVYRGRFRIFVRDQPTGTSCNVSGNAGPTGAWQHVAAVYDPEHGALALYVDGRQVDASAAAPRTILPADGALTIGSRLGLSGGYDETLDGAIDEVAIFRRPLSAAQVQALYDAGKPD